MGVGDDGLAARGLQDDESCEIDANSLWELVRCGEQACLRWGAKRPQKAGSSYAVEREQATSPQQARSLIYLALGQLCGLIAPIAPLRIRRASNHHHQHRSQYRG